SYAYPAASLYGQVGIKALYRKISAHLPSFSGWGGKFFRAFMSAVSVGGVYFLPFYLYGKLVKKPASSSGSGSNSNNSSLSGIIRNYFTGNWRTLLPGLFAPALTLLTLWF
ncbi:MAG: hypothetical protein NKF37_04035, partial [Tropheryma whipplei]|nr:hypothetical protein [Tropheryma whipplei]